MDLHSATSLNYHRTNFQMKVTLLTSRCRDNIVQENSAALWLTEVYDLVCAYLVKGILTTCLWYWDGRDPQCAIIESLKPATLCSASGYIDLWRVIKHLSPFSFYKGDFMLGGENLR